MLMGEAGTEGVERIEGSGGEGMGGEGKGVSVRVCRSWVARDEEMKRAEEGDEKSAWMRLE